MSPERCGEFLPSTERELALQAWRSSPTGWRPGPLAGAVRSLHELVEAGVLVPEPIVYEDFLPRSAAGIFQSNLTDEGTRDDDLLGTPYDMEKLSEVIGRPIADPTQLYEAQQSASLDAVAEQLGLAYITTTGECIHEHRLPDHR